MHYSQQQQQDYSTSPTINTMMLDSIMSPLSSSSNHSSITDDANSAADSIALLEDNYFDNANIVDSDPSQQDDLFSFDLEKFEETCYNNNYNIESCNDVDDFDELTIDIDFPTPRSTGSPKKRRVSKQRLQELAEQALLSIEEYYNSTAAVSVSTTCDNIMTKKSLATTTAATTSLSSTSSSSSSSCIDEQQQQQGPSSWMVSTAAAVVVLNEIMERQQRHFVYNNFKTQQQQQGNHKNCYQQSPRTTTASTTGVTSSSGVVVGSPRTLPLQFRPRTVARRPPLLRSHSSRSHSALKL